MAIKIQSNMIDTTVRKLLIGGSEEDFKVGVAIAAKKGLVREGLYAFEDVIKWSKRMHLEKVKWLQENYSEVILSGSIALFLHGCRSFRWEDEFYRPDIDLVLPYFVNITGPNISHTIIDHHPSGCDFQEIYNFEGVKLETTVDPQQRWEWITYDGFKYKVSDMLDIVQAKIKYAKKGGDPKHRNDLNDFMGKTTFGEYLQKTGDIVL